VEVSGNGRARQFFREHGMPADTKLDRKYHSRVAELYRNHVRQTVEKDLHDKV